MLTDSKPLYMPILIALVLLGLVGCDRNAQTNGAPPGPAPVGALVLGQQTGVLRTGNGQQEPATRTPVSPASAPAAVQPVAATAIVLPTFTPAVGGTAIPVAPAAAPAATAIPPANVAATAIPPAAVVATAIPPATPRPTALVAAPAATSVSPATGEAKPGGGGNYACDALYLHTVASNENVFRLALAYSTTMESIARLNTLSNVKYIKIGQKLLIRACNRVETPQTSTGGAPTAEHYVVQRGDNLFRIALRYDSTVEEIMAANGLNNNIIFPGQRLYLP